MMDERISKLAKQLVHHSTNLQKGEKVLIEVFGTTGEIDLARALVREADAVGAYPFIQLHDPKLDREMLKVASEEQIKAWASWDAQRMKDMDAYIGLRGGDNINEQTDISEESNNLYLKHYMSEVHHGIRVPDTRWVVLRFPTPSMAQSANMSTEGFEDFYFNTCLLDYSKMEQAMQSLKELMEKTDKVRITGKDTDLTFSIKGLPVIPSAGEKNIPDGEVFTAPVRDSINGKITYNAPSPYLGTTFENVCFEIKDGKIVHATANDTEKINQILDSDEGARYFGEFAIGVNPYILHPMKDILFDEKIAGSFHLTPGNAYGICDNGNKSTIHWDLVHIQRPEYGGGEMYFDDQLVRKDGVFVLPELEALNPENLKG